MLIRKSDRRDAYTFIERKLTRQGIPFETCRYRGIVNPVLAVEEVYVDPDDVAYYLTSEPNGRQTYLIPIIWVFRKEEDLFRLERIHKVMETNPYMVYHLVFCDPSWTVEYVQAFKDALTPPDEKIVTASRLEEWMSDTWKKVNKARALALSQLPEDHPMREPLTRLRIYDVFLNGKPHSVRLTLNRERDPDADIVASFAVSWVEEHEVRAIAAEVLERLSQSN